MKAKYARQIRKGITYARQIHRRERTSTFAPPLRMGVRPEDYPLWERAYWRERNAMVRDGRIKPPTGGSGASRP